MQINLSGKVVAGVLGTLALAGLTSFVGDHFGLRDRVTVLESDVSTNARQDAELAELRATLRDVMLLTRFNASPPSAPFESAPTFEMLDVEPPEYDAFRAEQMDLEAVLRSRGLEPTDKPLSTPRDIAREHTDESHP